MPLSDIYNRFNLQDDPYETMGLSQKCQEKDIRRAYYKLAVKFHPDKNNGAEECFKEILNAYAVLSEPHKRRSVLEMIFLASRIQCYIISHSCVWQFSTFKLGF